MIVGRYLLITVLVIGALATVRIGWVTYDYTQAVETLRNTEIEIVHVERADDDELTLTIEMRNQADLPITLDYLSLNLYVDGVRAGSTFDQVPTTRIEPRSTSEIIATVGLLSSAQLPDDLPSSLQFRGEWRLLLPNSDRPFQQPITIVWERES